jgi:hypothetical protein
MPITTSSSSLRGYRSVTGSLLLMGWLTLGCGQGEGDRCEITADCNEGFCDVTNGNGICRLTPTITGGGTGGDAGVGPGGTGGASGGGDAGADVKVDGSDPADAVADVSAVNGDAADSAHAH